MLQEAPTSADPASLVEGASTPQAGWEPQAEPVLQQEWLASVTAESRVSEGQAGLQQVWARPEAVPPLPERWTCQ
jgi:hypothetical protein